jgi:hypothetical protein
MEQTKPDRNSYVYTRKSKAPVRLLRHILPAAALPLAVLILAAIFSPVEPPVAWAAIRDTPAAAVQPASHQAKGPLAWVHLILCSDGD